MVRRERSRWWRVLAACLAWTCLALIGTDARASNLATQEIRAEPVATMASERMSGAADCMPCTLCFVAPAPSEHTFTAEAKEAEPRALRVAAAPALPAIRCPSESDRREHVPIRIAYCRWLD